MATSLVPITVEHPQYMQTFVVRVQPTGTISDIKHEIARTCPGHPREEGQRLISKGRILDDGEKIESLWTAPEDARVVHLAVNPLSWSSDPPKVSVVDDTPSDLNVDENPFWTEPHAFEAAPAGDIPTTPPAMLPHFETLSFICHTHHQALRALSASTPAIAPGSDGSASAKEHAKAVLQAANRSWPEIFDAEFPPATDGGVTYGYTLVGGKPFLENLTPHAEPSPQQQHALNVLSYTFPLLTLAPPHPTSTFSTVNNRTPLANAIQNMNFGPHRAEPNQNVRNVVAVRINMRELVTPLILLFIRTLILLYFFSPARKPIFGIIVSAYILYEAWGAVRGAVFDVGPLNGNNGAGRPNDRRPRPNAENGAARVLPPPNGAPPVQNPGAIAAANFEAGIDRLAQLSLDMDARWLESDAREPNVFYKFVHFVIILILSIHPAVWNRRRAALRAREGRLRTEANAAETAARQEAEGEEAADERARAARQQLIERHQRRPVWIRDYIERLRRGDWVDD